MNHLGRSLFLIFSALVLIAGGVCAYGQVIQTQESETLENVAMDLTSLEIKNNVLTVKFKLRNAGSGKQTIMLRYRDCYFMDEQNQKKYFALKDSDGNYIAGPLSDHGDGGRIWTDLLPGKMLNVWIKFPEPTDHPEKITMTIPGFFPFEDVNLPK